MPRRHTWAQGGIRLWILNIYTIKRKCSHVCALRGARGKRPSGINRSCSLACFSCLIGLRTSELPPSPSPLCCTTSQKETLAPNSPSYIAFCCTAKHSFFSRPSLCNVNLSRPRNQHDVGDSKIVVMKRVRFSSFVLEPCCLIDGLYCCSFLLFGTVPCHIFSPPSLQNISHAAEKLRA